MGRNRTGIDMSPQHSKEMIRDVEELTHAGPLDGEMLQQVRRERNEEADVLGSVPIPGTVKGALKSAMKKLTGRHPEALINKLGERLTFERTGVRIYEAVIAKCEARDGNGNDNGSTASSVGVSLETLQRFCDEEEEHFLLVKDAMESLGADPTAQTPDADVAAVASMGVQRVVTDPRTTVTQSLEALLMAELTDNAGWELLIRLTEEMGLDDLTRRFGRALEQEEEHLRQVRRWCEQGVLAQAG
jgi:bacterioferritin (cytochrome b1)